MSYRARRRRHSDRRRRGNCRCCSASSRSCSGTRRTNIETFSGGKADIFVAPAPHKLTEGRAESSSYPSRSRFVGTAVARVHPERAYDIAGPAMRGGLTRSGVGDRGDPGRTVPVESARWKVEYSNSEAVGLLVRVEPSQESQLRPTVFSMNMVPRVVDGKRTWLVEGWAPKGGSPATIGATSASPGQALSGAGAEEPERLSPQASRLWLLGAGAPDLPRLRGPSRLLRPGAAGVAQDAPVSRLASFVAAARRALAAASAARERPPARQPS